MSNHLTHASDMTGGREVEPLLPRSSADAAAAYARSKVYKPLSLLPLVALIFYDVSGGPFGIEDAVSSGTPLLAILGFLILPVVWSIPEALITAEMSTAFPENSGYVAWVTAAFGPFWGFQKGFWAWISGVTDNAVYPVMILTYLEQLWPVVGDGWTRTAFLVALNLSLAYLNYRGLHVVGNAAVAMVVFTLLPFVVLTLLALPSIRPGNWLIWRPETPTPGQPPGSTPSPVDWRTFLNVMFWNLNYWNSASCLSGEVSNPSRTIPRALFAAVGLVVVTYLVPLLTGLGVEPNRGEWTLGFFTTLAQRVGGAGLGWWMVASAAVSQVGQFEAEMCSDSYQLHGMAERGFLPAVFARKSRHGTPTLGIIASSIGVLAMASFDFLRIIELLNCVYCMSELLEFAAFLALRVRYPTLARPYRIPLGVVGCGLMLVPAASLLVGMVATPIVQRDGLVATFTLAACLLGFALHPLLQFLGRAGYLTFRGMTPAAFKEHLYTMYVPGATTPADGGDGDGSNAGPPSDLDDRTADGMRAWSNAGRADAGGTPEGGSMASRGAHALGFGGTADAGDRAATPDAWGPDGATGREETAGDQRRPPLAALRTALAPRQGSASSLGASRHGSARGPTTPGAAGRSPFTRAAGEEPSGPEFRLESVTYYDRTTLTPTGSLTPASTGTPTTATLATAGTSAFAPYAEASPSWRQNSGSGGASPLPAGLSPRKGSRNSSRLSSQLRDESGAAGGGARDDSGTR